jgi:Xaa-Pro aminopeptidase
MVVSVESYIGEKGGREGVKLEEEVLITETGSELISRFPYEDELLGCAI